MAVMAGKAAATVAEMKSPLSELFLGDGKREKGREGGKEEQREGGRVGGKAGDRRADR